jgi:general secretion pathway protein G
MAKRKASPRTILLPWETRRGLIGRLRLGRARPFLAALLVLGVIALLGIRERQRTGERATRAALLVSRRAIDAYRADHDGKCPRQLEELRSAGYVLDVPDDAWGRPLRLVCPGRNDTVAYDLLSDGPDGEPGGLDRIE